MSKTLNLTKELISKKSITPLDEGCQDLLISHLELLGFTIEKMPYGKVKNFYVPRLISGRTKKCTNIAKALYGQIFKKLILMSDMRSAEITKLFENIFRSVNIGLVNEMKKICSKMNIDVHEIINAAATKPYGFFKFLPGPGLGGHCIPIDPFYLSWKAKEFNIDTKFIKLAGVINRSMPTWVIKKISDYYKKNKKKLIIKIS